MTASSDRSSEDWNRLIKGLRDGETAVCNEFWQRYGSALQVVAARQLSPQVQRRVGADDVVQSACRSFFRRVQDGQFTFDDADSLWRLLCVIATTKAKRAARDQDRQKRRVTREVIPRDGEGNPVPQERFEDRDQATPSQLIALEDELHALLDGLSRQECAIVELKLQRHTNDEIAERLACSERTVRRVIERLKRRWEQKSTN